MFAATSRNRNVKTSPKRKKEKSNNKKKVAENFFSSIFSYVFKFFFFFFCYLKEGFCPVLPSGNRHRVMAVTFSGSWYAGVPGCRKLESAGEIKLLAMPRGCCTAQTPLAHRHISPAAAFLHIFVHRQHLHFIASHSTIASSGGAMRSLPTALWASLRMCFDDAPATP